MSSLLPHVSNNWIPIVSNSHLHSSSQSYTHSTYLPRWMRASISSSDVLAKMLFSLLVCEYMFIISNQRWHHQVNLETSSNLFGFDRLVSLPVPVPSTKVWTKLRACMCGQKWMKWGVVLNVLYGIFTVYVKNKMTGKWIVFTHKLVGSVQILQKVLKKEKENSSKTAGENMDFFPFTSLF